MWAESIYCIGNSLTGDCQLPLLDGTVGYNLNSGQTLQYNYDHTTADATGPSGPWRQAFAATQYDYITVQPSPGTTLDQDATVISAWMALEPNAKFVLHTGWAHSDYFETEYHGGNLYNLCNRSPEYMNDLIAEVAQRTGRTMVSTRANDALDMIYHDIQHGVGPFTDFSDIYRDVTHLNETGQFLAHDLMRQAIGEPLLSFDDPNFPNVPAATKDYLVGIVHAVPEPSSVALLAFGLSGIAGYAWRRRRAAP